MLNLSALLSQFMLSSLDDTVKFYVLPHLIFYLIPAPALGKCRSNVTKQHKRVGVGFPLRARRGKTDSENNYNYKHIDNILLPQRPDLQSVTINQFNSVQLIQRIGRPDLTLHTIIANKIEAHHWEMSLAEISPNVCVDYGVWRAWAVIIRGPPGS